MCVGWCVFVVVGDYLYGCVDGCVVGVGVVCWVGIGGI